MEVSTEKKTTPLRSVEEFREFEYQLVEYDEKVLSFRLFARAARKKY